MVSFTSLVKRPPMLFVPLLALALAAPAARGQEVEKDVPYVPTPEEVVEKMLELAQPKKGEILYDLGCGDGRIVVTAAKKYGVKGTGVDIDPQRIKESNENAKEAGVTDQVKFVTKNLFEMDFKDADIVTLYLLTSVNARLRPQLLEQLRPGTRIVSHAFDMGDWTPDQEVTVDPGGQNVYFWIIPAKVEGSHTVKLKGAGGKSQEAKLELKQQFQKVTGTATIGGKQVEIEDGTLRGRELSFTAGGQKYTATVGGDDKSLAGGDAEDSDAAQTAGEKEKGEAGESEQPKQQQDDSEAPAAGEKAGKANGAGKDAQE